MEDDESRHENGVATSPSPGDIVYKGLILNLIATNTENQVRVALLSLDIRLLS